MERRRMLLRFTALPLPASMSATGSAELLLISTNRIAEQTPCEQLTSLS